MLFEIDSSIFKLNDIRGYYPRQINEQVAFLIGAGFAKSQKGKTKPKIVVSRDDRFSSQSLVNSLVQGLIKNNARVIDIGANPTPLFYFAVNKLSVQGGIQVTASHNSLRENGFKIFVKKEKYGQILNDFRNLKKQIRSLEKNFHSLERQETTKNKNLIKKIDLSREYIRFSIKPLFVEKIFPNFQVYIVIPQSFPIKFLETLKSIMPFKVKLVKNINSLPQKIFIQPNTLVTTFDPDGDRIFFFTGARSRVLPEIIGSLIIKHPLKKSLKKKKVVYTVFASNILKEAIQQSGAQAIPSRVGHALIKKKMMQYDADIGIEYSGHYMFKEFGYCEAPLYVLSNLIKIILREKATLKELAKNQQSWYNSGVINFRTQKKDEIIAFLKNRYKDKGKVNTLDGLRVDMTNWWFGVRESHTEDRLRLMVEAKTKKLLRQKEKEIKFLIRSLS